MTAKTMIRPLMTALTALLITGCSAVTDNDDAVVTERVSVGDRLPPFVVTVTDGTSRWTVSSALLTGETVIVFFNTSCKDCQRDLPLLNEYYLQHRDEPGFQMIAISREEGEESVAAYWAANALQIPYSPQNDRSIYNLFASSIIPRIYFATDAIVTRIDIEKFGM